MADFYVAPTLEFDVPNGHAFYTATDAVAIVRPSTDSRFVKLAQTPVMVRQRNVVG
jgi:hypothetical protein